MVNRELKLSRIEKILLHLNKFNRFRDRIEVPSVLTQEGIADATGIARRKVSTMMRKLEEDSLVQGKMRHIQGRKRRQKTYVLTDAGIREAGTLKIGLDQSQYIDFADHTPQLEYFFGREDEFRKFKGWLESSTCKILVVSGIAGIGKTACVAKAVEPFKESMHIFWYRFNEWSTLRGLLTRLGDFLSEIGKERLNANLQARKIIDINEISIILSDEFNYLNALLVFDDYQKVQDKKEVAHMFGALRQLLEEVTGTKLIVVGRGVPRFFYDEREVSIKGTVKELELRGLDRKSSLKLLEMKGIKGNEGERVYKLTKGHPLSLELIHETERLETQDELKRFVSDEILSLLNPRERMILEIASVFRFPIYPTAYLDIARVNLTKDTKENIPLTLLAIPFEENDKPIEGIDHDIIDSLVKKSLLKISGGVCDIHDMIREFLYGLLPKQIKKKYHKIIAIYYQQEMGETPQTILEAQYHYLMAEEYQEAAVLAVDTGKKLVMGGYWQEMLETLNGIPFDSIEPESRAEILLLRGRIYMFEGERDKALDDYENSIALFQKIGNKMREGTGHTYIGQLSRDDETKSLESFQRALQLSKEVNDDSGAGKAHQGISVILWIRGEFDKALVELEKALDCSLKSNDDHLVAYIYSSLGGVMRDKEEYDKAIEYYILGLSILEKICDKIEMANISSNLGILYSCKGILDEAVKWYEKSMMIAGEIGNIRLLAEGLGNAAREYGTLGELQKALLYCERLVSISEKLDDNNLRASAQMVYGQVYTNKKDWDMSEQHFKNGLDISTDQEQTAEIHLNYGRMLVEKGKKTEAKKHFEESMTIYNKLGNKNMIEVVKKEMKI